MLLLSQHSSSTCIITPTNSNLPIFIDREDYEWISKYKWHLNKHGYVVGYPYFKRSAYLHRFLLNLHQGKSVVDHIDRNKLNNCRANLRIVTNQLNSYNAPKRSGNRSSKYIGVSFDKTRGRWMAVVGVNGKAINLGRFDTEIEAAQTRDRYMIKHFAQHALLNFPLETYL